MFVLLLLTFTLFSGLLLQLSGDLLAQAAPPGQTVHY